VWAIGTGKVASPE